LLLVKVAAGQVADQLLKLFYGNAMNQFVSLEHALKQVASFEHVM